MRLMDSWDCSTSLDASSAAFWVVEAGVDWPLSRRCRLGFEIGGLDESFSAVFDGPERFCLLLFVAGCTIGKSGPSLVFK